MGVRGTSGDDRAGQRCRWLFTYSVSGDLRFISHHDTLRLFQRAAARAGLPVRYSAGFNPRPRITILLPRPVGVASDHELAVIETDAPVDPQQAQEALDRHTPADLRVLGVRRLEPGERPQPRLVRYRIEPSEPPIAGVGDAIRRVLESSVVPCERVNPRKATRRSLNLRPYIADLHEQGSAVIMTLMVTGDGTARPSEVAAALGYPSTHTNHRVRRLEIQWQ